MEHFFHLKENGTSVPTEIAAGLTTFFAMSYIIVVNPQILSQTGMPWGGVFLATIIAAVIGTLVMGLFANVPYAQAAGMGLNAFFTYTVCFGLGFPWQQTLCMVFLCGLINIIITVTKIRKMIITAIPPVLQHAIGGGIGLFVAYVGMLNVGLITFTPKDTKAAGKGLPTEAVPGLAVLDKPVLWVFLIGLLLAIVFTLLNVKAGLLLTIVITALIGIPLGVTTMSNSVSIGQTFSQLPTTMGAIFTAKGFPALFSDVSRLPIVLVTIFAFSMSDTFDTIGTFIGTGRRTGIFSKKDEEDMANGSGFSSKMDRALFADSIATSIGAIFGTSNTTTYVESAAGIGAGGRTGLTSVVVSICFILSIFFAPIISAVPAAATAGVLVVVGCMMAASLKEVNWNEITEAIPAFFAAVFMAFSYSISYGIATGFIAYCLVMACKKKANKVHPIVWVVAVLFAIDFALQAVL
ncbi:NCS2 family permease [Bifidobacterium mongoliense]|jgi:AGZA family xanthine/uracil permease-like MFS transporter|uniref:Guanine permease n=2 Tax=Bifidobacterium mongoliense TaxID=518643 RepID=A0A087BTG6_9BIFI|nr:NCS2 family permease [Bifidobacterium mongoliense]KFI74316.1 guanine permease [Bifidobacterium mongoliense DSM 21395]MDN5633598.1 NCS2 family permease [Bifidobacterium mongoliense]MDN5979225.1 NCS2 family permease [Bifidobacterium mongoliense]MDN6024544.1 NCS2 family permease [Bifidobacterium mongoliense]MDN6050653.1 NCS2 family permease [Bifidobacterium mongoliense]